MNLEHVLESPSLVHWFGTDAFGRDLLAACLIAFSRSLVLGVGIVSVSIGLAIGVSISAIRIRFLWNVLLFFIDLLSALPTLLVALALAVVFPPGWATLIFCMFAAIAPGLFRLFMARLIELESEGFVLAARALGSPALGLGLRHQLPELWRLGRAKAPFLIAQTVLLETAMTFVGAGGPVGSLTWGALLAQGTDYLLEAPHIAFYSGLPLGLVLIGLQGLQRYTSLNGPR